MLWPSDAANTYKDGMALVFFPCSDFMNQGQLIFSNVNKLTIELGLNTYGKAITDVSNTLTTAATSIWDGATSNFSAFELYDVEFHLKKLYVNEDVTAACLATLNSEQGIRIPFCSVSHHSCPFATFATFFEYYLVRS